MRTGTSQSSPTGGSPPPGILAFMIADVRGYTSFTDQRGDEAAAQLARRFVRLAGDAVTRHSGTVLEVRGDEVLAIFDSPRAALRAGVALQSALGTEAGQDPELPILAGVGIDVGEAVPFDEGYRGRALNMAARLCARAGPGEILITPELAHLAGPSEGIAYEDRGPVRLKGFSRPVQLTAVVSVDASGTSSAEASTADERPSLGSLEFKILGPLDVARAGRAVPIGGRRQRLVLAYLILEANHVVSMDDLIDRVWGDEPPKAARGTIQSYISHLRSAVGAERIEGKAPGYVFFAEVDEVDVLRFERLTRRARRHLETDPAQAVGTFEEALALWRGSPLADLAESEALAGEIARLEELREAVVEELIGARLAMGEHVQVIGDLERLIARDPLRERLWAHLMLALYRSGRQADALEAFGRARTILADELGIDPSAELRELQERILKQDPTLELTGRPLRSYRLLEVIGEGAFGVVWRGIDPGVGREVAVKQIHPRLANDPEFVRRFEQEAQTVARLEHPHIVPLYDYWRDGNGAYLVMRLMRGRSLAEVLNGGPVGIETAVRLVEQIASALSAAHRRRLVHRDVKPENILLDEDGNAYLSDFGMAEDQARSEPSPHGWSNLGFRSPEQIRGADATPRSDIYALGVVLKAMLGRTDLPRAFIDVVERATAADPAERFDDALEFAEQLGAALKAVAPQAAVAEPSETRNPYKGLRPFTEGDAGDFFGRDALIERLVSRLSEDPTSSRFLAVVGPSGSGKSSVVRAGLLPALRAGAVEGSARWFYADMLPGPRPMEELEAALLSVAVDPPGSLIDALERDERGLERAVESVLPDENSELLLLIDQFEEIFTLVDQEETRARFLESLVAAVSAPESRLRVVVTIRADFYDRPLAYPGLAELIRSRIETVVPLTAEELERAIAGPAGSVGVTPELALVAEVVADVSDQPGPLPLMQYALTETFERRRDGILTLEAYRETGGVTGALARRAERLFTEMNETGREAARQLFLRLVSVRSGADDTRRLVPRAELGSLEVDPDAMEEVIDAFGNHRLLSFDRDPDSRAPTVEVAHEALLREWGRLRGWIDASREDIFMHRRLVAEATEWERSGRDPSFLLRGSRLVQFEGWVDLTALALSTEEREYVHESVKSRESEQAEEETRVARERALERRSRTRLRTLVAVLTAAALVATTLTVVAVNQRSNALGQEHVATARELAAAATANLDVDPQRSILLALAAIGATDPVLPEAVPALHAAIAADREILTLKDPSTANVAWSPDGRLLATGGSAGGNDQTDVLLWDARTGAMVHRLPGHTKDISYVAFSPDSTRVVAVAADDSTIVWNTRTGKEIFEIHGQRGFLLGARFSPDGRRLVVAEAVGNGYTVSNLKLNASTTHPAWRVRLVGGSSSPPLFSPDGKRIAVSGDNGTFLLNSSNGARFLLVATPGGASDLAFSPDGGELATANGNEGDIWNVRTGKSEVSQPEFRLLGEKNLAGIDWSSDGRFLATGGNDGTARIWNASSGEQLLVLAGHSGGVALVAFSPDGTKLLTGGGDGTARVWDIRPAATAEVFGGAEPNTLSSVSYNSDGSRLLTSEYNGAPAWLWDSKTGQRVQGFSGVYGDAAFGPGDSTLAVIGNPLAILKTSSGDVIQRFPYPAGPDNYNSKLAYSPDGTLIATAQHSGVAALYEASTGELVKNLGNPSLLIDSMNDVAFSPDGKLLAGISGLATVYLWSIPSRNEVFHKQAQSGEGTSVAFSPDGTEVATGGLDGAAVWSTSGKRLAVMNASSRVESVTFSSDGRMLATGGDDHVARIWDVATGRQILALPGNTDVINAVAFSPDGTKLATAAADGTLRVYSLSTANLVGIARSLLTRGLSDAECLQYLHTSTCPTSLGETPVRPTSPGPGVGGPEGAYRITLTSADLHRAGWPNDGSIPGNTGDYTWSFANGSWRMHAQTPFGPDDWSGTYAVSGDGIKLTTQQGDPNCLGSRWSGRWSLGATSLSFTHMFWQATTTCGPRGVRDAVVRGLFQTRPWTRVL